MLIFEVIKYFLILVILLVPLLYLLNPSFRFNVKMCIFYLTIYIVGHIAFLFIVPFYGDISNYSTLKRILLFCCKPFNIKWEIKGAENLKSDKPFIVVCNHQSSLDIIGMMEFWPSRCVGMAKSSLKYLGAIGIVITACGTVFIERSNKDKAMDTMSKVSDRIDREQIKLWIFPEGTRHHEAGMLPFKKGAFHLAVQSQVASIVTMYVNLCNLFLMIPIVPLVFSRYNFFYNKVEKKFLSKGFVLAEALKPIQTKGLTSKDVTELSIKTREKMLSVYEKISLEAAQRYENGNF